MNDTRKTLRIEQAASRSQEGSGASPGVVTIAQVVMGQIYEYRMTRLSGGVTLQGFSRITVEPEPLGMASTRRFTASEEINIGGEKILRTLHMSQSSDGTLYCHGLSGPDWRRLVVNSRGGFYTYLRSPLMVGDSYATHIRYDDGSGSIWQCTVEAMEELTVPAGTFLTCRTAMVSHEERGGITNYQSWYSPEMTYPVKGIRSSVDSIYIRELIGVSRADGAEGYSAGAGSDR